MRRHVLLGLVLAASLLLIVGEFGNLNRIAIGGVARDGQGMGDNHGYALLIIAIAAAAMAFGVWSTGARPAAAALVALGAAAVFVIVAIAAPDVDATGRTAELYSDVGSETGSGFRTGAAGAVLLLFSSVLTLVAERGPAPSTAAAPPSRS